MGLPMVPLGGAELPTCRPRARWRGAGAGLLERKGKGSMNWDRTGGVGLVGSLGTWVEEERYVEGERLAESIYVSDLLKEEDFRIYFFDLCSIGTDLY